MKITAISDLHGQWDILKTLSGDLLIIAGDIANHGKLAEYFKFNKLLGTLDFKYKIFIAGNHDKYLYTDLQFAKREMTNGIYLFDNTVEIEGIKIYGSPWTTPFLNWFFMMNEGNLFNKWSHIPEDIDIVITHGPPFQILDQNYKNESVGSIALRYHIERVKPTYHIFGHIHNGYGISAEPTGTIYLNASHCTEDYEPINKPWELEI